MSHSHHEPSVLIDENLAIGYRRNSLRRTPEICLATAENQLELQSGRHLLLARNGRGKTTLLKTIAGVIPALRGSITSTGSVQFVDEDLRFDSEMKPRQIFAAIFPKSERGFALEMAERIQLDVEKPYGKLSKGNRQKVGLIIAEASTQEAGPHVLLLDEPFSGLDFDARDRIDEIWRERSDGIVRIVCIHPDEPTLKADSALVIRENRLEQLHFDKTLDWEETRAALD